VAEAPSIEELGPLIGDSAALDEPAPPDAEPHENGAYEAAAVRAVGTREKAAALKDAMVECLREHGLLPSEEPALEAEDDGLGSVGDLGDESDY
jgi:hypothetical protein